MWYVFAPAHLLSIVQCTMSSPDPKAKKLLVLEWQAVLKQALDVDSWGQALEAVDEYEK